MLLFFLDVLGEDAPKLLEFRHIVWVVGFHVLELLEQLFNSVVLSTVTLCHFLAFRAHVLFKGGIDNELFTYRVTSELPGELVPEALLMIMVGGVDDLIVVLLQLTVVFGYGI